MTKKDYIIIAMVLFAFTACRETSTEERSEDTINSTTPNGDTTSSIKSKTADDIVTYTQGDMDQTGFMNQDMSQNYSELEMSDEQIQSYESRINGTGANATGTETNQGEERDKAMKAILTDVQYDKYEMMKKNTSKSEDQ